MFSPPPSPKKHKASHLPECAPVTTPVTDDASLPRESPKEVWPHSAARYTHRGAAAYTVRCTHSNSAACVYSSSGAPRKVGARLEGKWAPEPGRRAGRNQGSATRKWPFSRHSPPSPPPRRESGTARARRPSATKQTPHSGPGASKVCGNEPRHLQRGGR